MRPRPWRCAAAAAAALLILTLSGPFVVHPLAGWFLRSQLPDARMAGR